MNKKIIIMGGILILLVSIIGCIEQEEVQVQEEQEAQEEVKEKNYTILEIDKNLFFVYTCDYRPHEHQAMIDLKEGIKELVAQGYKVKAMVPYTDYIQDGFAGGSRTTGYYVFVEEGVIEWN